MKDVQISGACPQRVRHRQVELRRKVHEKISNPNTRRIGINVG